MSNKALPVANFRDDIVEAVRKNSVTIITAETGAGKSTQVPQYLLDEGYDIVVTQPRRVAAETVAQRVAEEFGTPFGEVVGFRTAYDKLESAATRCLFVTDGLALVRELMGAGTHQVLVLDEVHEWNLNMDTLVAWAKHQVESGSDFKLVLMSATLEAERLAEYFGGAPVISVPGRTFPVEECEPGASLEADVLSLLQQGRNVLVFQPGKGEITRLVSYLNSIGDLNAEIMPLHGELTRQEQLNCFNTFGRPKCVVSTNVAQTSVTIPDIDAVIDSGLERRIELVDGVEGLYLRAVSYADGAQRKGRAGRTKPGVYVDWCTVAPEERLAFPRAEILRTRLDQTVLRLAEAGFDMEELKFFHQPDLAKIHDAKRALRSLGCMDATGKVTKIGHLVAKLPISVQYARMIVEADRLDVVDDVITVAAILEQGELNARVCPDCKKYGHRSCACWQKLVPGEIESDVLAQLAVYQAAENINRKDMLRRGIFPRAFYQAKEKRRHLASALRGKVKLGTSGKKQDILRAVCAGMVDHLYQQAWRNEYQGGDDVRQLGRESIVQNADWLVGQPWDLQIETRCGPAVLHLIKMASKVNPEWLIDVAPQLAELKEGLTPRYDRDQDEVVSTTELWFNGLQIRTFQVLDPNHVEASRLRREGRNNEQWQNWVDKPEIALPDLADDAAMVPDIVVCTYGADVETGTPLVAYGVIASYGYRYYSTDPWFRVLWTQDQAEAERHHTEARTRLEVIRVEAKAAAERQRVTEEVAQLKEANEPLRQELRRLWENTYDSALPWELRDRLVRQRDFPMYSVTAEKMREWRSGAEALVREIADAIAVAESRKLEAARQLAEFVKTARSLRDEANVMLIEYEDMLDADMYDRLTEFDVDDNMLPLTSDQLEGWITRARQAIAEAQEAVRNTSTSLGVGADQLAALASRFNR